MQLAHFVAIDMTWPFRGDADPVEYPEEAAMLDKLDEAAIERDAEDLVRVIELTRMSEPRGCPEISLRRRVEPLCDTALIGTPILWLRLRSSERSNRQ